MKTPKFYYKKAHILAYILVPFSLIFLILSFFRNLFLTPHILPNKFVICIGNATLGGAGKTPSAFFIGQILKENGIDFCFLSKGYGRKSKGFLKVDDGNVNKTGDEPQILKKLAPTYLFSKYAEIILNLRYIEEKVIIMDDGMQNPFIKKNITILVLDGNLLFGNSLLFPAGPLREFKTSATKKADFILQIEGEENPNSFILKRKYLLVNCNKGETFIAFSGLAINEKFFSSLKKEGMKVVETHEFEDHHEYTNKEIEALLLRAKTLNAKLITTEKDATKLSANNLSKIGVMYLSLESEQEIKQQIFTLLSL